MASDRAVLTFIHSRMVNVHGENPNYDYMLNLARIRDETDALRKAAEAVLKELDIIREDRTKRVWAEPMMVHPDTHSDLRAALHPKG